LSSELVWALYRREIFLSFAGIHTPNRPARSMIIIIIIIIIITAIEFSLGGSSPYTGTDKTNKNKYT